MEASDRLHGVLTPGTNSGTHSMRFGRARSCTRLYEEEESPLTLVGIKPRFLDRSARSLVATSTEIWRLLYVTYCHTTPESRNSEVKIDVQC
jgi:hypothetical protein